VETQGFGESMTDKDSQLDEIERLAQKCQVAKKGGRMIPFTINAGFCCPGGLYYEMRRQHQKMYRRIEELEASFSYTSTLEDYEL